MRLGNAADKVPLQLRRRYSGRQDGLRQMATDGTVVGAIGVFGLVLRLVGRRRRGKVMAAAVLSIMRMTVLGRDCSVAVDRAGKKRVGQVKQGRGQRNQAESGGSHHARHYGLTADIRQVQLNCKTKACWPSGDNGEADFAGPLVGVLRVVR